MQIVSETKPLLAALNSVSKIVDKRSPVAALANVLFSYDDSTSTIRVSGRNTLAAMTRAVKVDVVENCGAFTVDPRVLIERIKACDTSSVRLVEANGKLTVFAVGSKRRFVLRVQEDEEQIKELDAPAGFDVKAGKMLDYISSALPSVSADMTRPHLNSMLLIFQNKDLVATVSTDGHRLTMIGKPEEAKKKPIEALIALSGLGAVVRLCEELGAEDDVATEVRAKEILFGTDDTTIELKLTDASFPPYEKVIPQRKGASVKLDRERMRKMVSAVGVAADALLGAVKITIADNKIEARSESAETGESYDEADVVYDGKSTTIGLSRRYLADGLSAGTDEEIQAYFGDELSPMLLVYADRDVVLMPMRV